MEETEMLNPHTEDSHGSNYTQSDISTWWTKMSVATFTFVP